MPLGVETRGDSVGAFSRFEVGCQSAGVGVVAASLRLSGRPRAHVGAELFAALSKELAGALLGRNWPLVLAGNGFF